MENETNNQTVGYAKPPVLTRWAKGQSGNRRGRPRGSKNTLNILNKLANEEITMSQNGRSVRISKKAAALLQAINKAAQGDTKVLRTLFPHLLAADAKMEGRSDYLDLRSPKVQAALEYFLDLFVECIYETPGLDAPTIDYILVLLSKKAENFEEKLDKKLNNPHWKPAETLT